MKELRKIDVTALLPTVQAPTLVLHRSGLAAITVEMAREVAASIPNARLMLFDGTWIAPFFGESGKEIASAIRSFVQEATEPPITTEALNAAPASLTPRETEVLRMLASGSTSREIAAKLSLSVRTVGRHITNIYAKIGARTRADATAWAIRHGIA
jgi:DNA-binding CsgD family transcriptional regulator